MFNGYTFIIRAKVQRETRRANNKIKTEIE